VVGTTVRGNVEKACEPNGIAFLESLRGTAHTERKGKSGASRPAACGYQSKKKTLQRFDSSPEIEDTDNKHRKTGKVKALPLRLNWFVLPSIKKRSAFVGNHQLRKGKSRGKAKTWRESKKK